MMAAERGLLRVVGRYALYNEIAAGGMATVHIGRLLGPVGFARTVAVKRLHPQYAKDPEFVSMFLDEARLAARVQHPNVVATIDVVATDGELFLIMDYVRGESLSKLVRAAKKMGLRVPPRVAASIMCGFLHGLHAAHEAKNERGEPINLVHRDVSPQNVLVGSDGIARVLDFGIAKAQGRIQVTRDGQIKGKLAYMPPEQLAGRDLSRACDIYASAVVMWETLTGERLFKGETEGETLAKILRDPVVAPSVVDPSLPHEFDNVLLRALSREPGRRHATARELSLELERCVGVASPTEVGEWVEAVVGPTLNAREEQIAEIESNSAGIRVSPSGHPQTDSDSDVSGIPAGKNGTLIGVGSPSGTMPIDPRPSSRRRLAPPTPTAPTQVMASPPTSDDGTGSRLTGSKLTSSLLTLPFDKKLPILASVLGLGVLLGIVVVVLLRHGGEDAAADPAASAASAVASAIAPSASQAERPEPSATEDPRAVPPPEPTASAAPSATASSAPSARPTATVAAPRPTATARPTATPRPTAPAHPTTTAPKPPPKSCDPPWTIDAKGRKHYKVNCL